MVLAGYAWTWHGIGETSRSLLMCSTHPARCTTQGSAHGDVLLSYHHRQVNDPCLSRAGAELMAAAACISSPALAQSQAKAIAEQLLSEAGGLAVLW